MVNALRTERRKEIISGQLILMASVGALLSGAVLLLAIIFFDKKIAQMIIFSISPLALIPLIPLFYRLHAPYAPTVSKISLTIACIGIVPILIASFLVAIQRFSGSYELFSGTISSFTVRVGGATGLLGIWMILSGYLSIESKSQPVVLAIAGMFTGFCRVIIIAGVLLSSFNSWPQLSLSSVWNACLLLWISSYLLWTFWLGGWLFIKKNSVYID